jgi:molybdopterin-guanine dinucleotide biosynthesis protein MobB
MKTPPVIVFVGPHNSGKTGLVEQLTKLLAKQEVRVGVVKRAARPLQFDQPGKDSARFTAAGAAGIVAVGPGSVFYVERPSESPTMKDITRRFGRDFDLWLAESYVVEPVPWIAVCRAGQQMAAPDRNCIATVAPRAIRSGLPNFSWQKPGVLLQFILKFARLEGQRG